MISFFRPLSVVVLALSCSLTFAVSAPSQTATIVVRGFEQSGASSTGTFGLDEHDDSISALAASIGLPTSDVSPLATNQVAYTDFYGTHFPPYYTQQDIDELTSVTHQYGGGVPRYALIVAKYAREVMRRSGAKQINLFAPSFGALVARWMIEKDVGGLVSSGKVARWIAVEGVVTGNWIASEGGQSLYNFLQDQYDLDTVDLEQMRYDWIDANIHNPHDASASPFLGLVETHIWSPSDASLNSEALTVALQKPNDGIQLLRDEFFMNLDPVAKYLGQIPTKSAVHATHESSKQDLGLRVGIAADLFGRRRVKITLSDVFVFDSHENSSQGNGEFVFGVKVYSPRGQTLYGIADPIQDLRHDDHNVPYFRFPSDTTTTINLTWFDDMVLPGEDHLVLHTGVNEIDYDPIYGISENIFDPDQSLEDAAFNVSTLAPGTYGVFTSDWRGIVNVSVTDYPAFDPVPTSASDWTAYY